MAGRPQDRAAAAHHGFEPAYGRRVAGDLAVARLTHGGCLGRASMWRGGEPGGEIWRLSLMQLREGIVASGLMEPAEADAAIELCSDPRLSTLSPVMVTAWGRRPS